MGYKIVYGPVDKQKTNFLRLQTIIATFLLIFAVFVRFSWPEGRAYLQSILFSPAMSHGAEAMAELLRNLESGDSIQDAVVVFCQELIYGG